MPDESEFLLVTSGFGKEHIVDVDEPTRTYCKRPLLGTGQFADARKNDLKPADWIGDGEWRQRTLADQRANRGHFVTVCDLCLKNAGVTS